VDLLQRDRRPRDVLRQAFLSGLVEDANAVVDTEPGMLPGQEVAGEVIVQKFAVHQELDDPTAEYLDHRLEPRERDVGKGTLIIETALEDDRVKVRIPPQLVSEALVRDDHAGKQRSAGRLMIELVIGKVSYRKSYPGQQGASAVSDAVAVEE
jgi:hypothetical protein